MRKQLCYFLLILSLLSLNACQPPQEGAAVPVVELENDQPHEMLPANEPELKVPDLPAVVEPPPSNASGTSYSWSFTRNNNHQPTTIPPEAAKLLEQYPALYLGPADHRQQVYLTFDCGYEQGFAPAILDTLKTQEVKAIFFLTGHYVRSQPELVKRMLAEGHLLGNHSDNHPDFSSISQQQLVQELDSLNNAYRQLTGEFLSPYARPPEGRYSAQSLYDTAAAGYTSVFWSMAFHDWDPQNQPGADWVYQHIMDNIHPGAIILLHIVSQSDTEALNRIISDLKVQGYSFATFE